MRRLAWRAFVVVVYCAVVPPIIVLALIESLCWAIAAGLYGALGAFWEDIADSWSRHSWAFVDTTQAAIRSFKRGHR